MGKTWGAPHWGDWRALAEAKDWRVAGIKVLDPWVPGKQWTFHITSVSSYLGSGITADIWFEKGIGVVREEDIHHGTIGKDRTCSFASSLPAALAIQLPEAISVPTPTP